MQGKDKNVKRTTRSDKRNMVDNMAEKAEKAAQMIDIGTPHRITKQLCKNN